MPAAICAVGPSRPAAPPEPHYANLFARIRSGFELPDPNKRIVAEEAQWYANHPEFLQRAFGRADMYLYYIVTQLQARHMPLELALLPVIESAFRPFAYSYARAAGMWQFTSGTGKLFGLKQDWWYDGRRDVVASTQAALNYLQQLHDQLGGHWLLAIAAYNCGELNVQRAIRYNRERHRPTDFWHLILPRQTELYVPQLLAMARLVQDPAKYGLSFSPIPDRPYFTKVPTDGQINLEVAARLAGISSDEIYQLNPAFHRWATDPTGPFYLLLPVDAREIRRAVLGLRCAPLLTGYRGAPPADVDGLVNVVERVVELVLGRRGELLDRDAVKGLEGATDLGKIKQGRAAGGSPRLGAEAPENILHVPDNEGTELDVDRRGSGAGGRDHPCEHQAHGAPRPGERVERDRCEGPRGHDLDHRAVASREDPPGARTPRRHVVQRADDVQPHHARAEHHDGDPAGGVEVRAGLPQHCRPDEGERYRHRVQPAPQAWSVQHVRRQRDASRSVGLPTPGSGRAGQ